MARRWAPGLGMALLLCALAACSPPWRAGPVKVSGEDVGRRIELRTGQFLEVTLAANPTTGYTWMVWENDESILRPVGEPAFTPQSQLLGASGVQVLRFEAAASGETTLTLAYLRPWESVQPLERYAIDVVVQ